MTLIFPIVGLRHYLTEEVLNEFMTSMPEGVEVVLVYDNANAYDRYAIQAWMDLSINGEAKQMQVGYVASDFAPMIRYNYPDAQMLHAVVVHPDTSAVDETCFEAQIEVEQLALPILPPRVDMSPIANIPLPMVPPEKEMVWSRIMAYSQTPIEPAEVLQLARQSEPMLGHGLSGTERMAYILMSTMLAYVHGLWTDLTDDIWQMRMSIDDTHRDAFKTPECCAAIMDEEMQMLKERTASFFNQYTAALKAGLTTKETELKAHQEWLKALPDNLYASINDRGELASRLYYERFTTDELYAIYLHLYCIEWLKQRKGLMPTTDTSCQRILAFPYWDSYMDYSAKEEAFFRLQRAWHSNERYPVSALAEEIRTLIRENRIDPPDILSKFTQAINALLEIELKTNSLAKHLRCEVKKGTESASRKASRHKEKMQNYLSDYQ